MSQQIRCVSYGLTQTEQKKKDGAEQKKKAGDYFDEEDWLRRLDKKYVDDYRILDRQKN